jgi:hypothetical protein
MGQQHGIHRIGRNGQRRPIAQAQLFVALEQPAVDQQAVAVMAYQVFGAGDGVGTAQKCDVDAHGKCPLK